MPIRLPASLVISLALITSACSAPMKTPDIKQNLHPTKRYEITMTIEGAPGPFNSVEGYVRYQITNEECAPRDRFAGIYHTPPDPIPPVKFNRISDNVFAGFIYLDLMQDEDYYGLGVCHWAVNIAGVTLKAKSATFETSISPDYIVAQKSSAEYFPKSSYFETVVEPSVIKDSSGGTTYINTSISGVPIDATGAEYAKKHAKEFFIITLAAKKASQ